MKHTLLFLLPLLFFNCGQKNKNPNMSYNTNKPIETRGEVIRIDSEIDKLISKDAVIEVLAQGYNWTEGPLWIEAGQYLLFSEIPSNSIYKWSEAQGAELYISPSGYTGETERAGEPGSNGLILDPQNRLVMCQHGDRRMARMATPLDKPSSNFETIIDNWEGKRFNSPNDAIYDSRGNLYFTDPPYGLVKNMNDPEKEIDFQGVYRYSAAGELSLQIKTMTRPNGLALSPDEKKMYVANSDPDQAIWNVYDVDENGNLSNERLFYDVTNEKGKGLPDGMKIDPKGYIWATGPGGVLVFTPEAKLLGRIDSKEATSNCAFNTDYSILYMTCDDYLMRIKLN